jgi:GNAT superfamily N-acetyltransferase
MKAEDYGLTVVHVETGDHVETLRGLRNVCRGTFSFDNDEIGYEQQEAWWDENQGSLEAFLYYDGDDPVGFGVLRRNPDTAVWNTTVAVRPAAQGMGFGKAITADLIRRRPRGSTVIGWALLTNPAGQKLHRLEDWTEMGRTDTHILYRVRDEVPHALSD